MTKNALFEKLLNIKIMKEPFPVVHIVVYGIIENPVYEIFSYWTNSH